MLIPIIDRELCISCGNCVDICPDMFRLDDEEKAEVIDPGGCGTKCPNCQEAAEACPTNAITFKESEGAGAGEATGQ